MLISENNTTPSVWRIPLHVYATTNIFHRYCSVCGVWISVWSRKQFHYSHGAYWISRIREKKQTATTQCWMAEGRSCNTKAEKSRSVEWLRGIGSQAAPAPSRDPREGFWVPATAVFLCPQPAFRKKLRKWKPGYSWACYALPERQNILCILGILRACLKCVITTRRRKFKKMEWQISMYCRTHWSVRLWTIPSSSFHKKQRSFGGWVTF